MRYLKTLKEQKIEAMLDVYRMHERSLEDLELDDEISEIVEAELFWIGIIIEDLEWILNDDKPIFL